MRPALFVLMCSCSTECPLTQCSAHRPNAQAGQDHAAGSEWLTGSSQNAQRSFPPMKSVTSFQSVCKFILYAQKDTEWKLRGKKVIIIKAGQQTKHKFHISQETSGDLYFSVASQKNEFVVMAWRTNYYDLNKVSSISNTIQNYWLLKNSAKKIHLYIFFFFK